MGLGDKIKADMDKAKGKAKEAAGKATNNDQMIVEGKAEQVKGDLKHATENIKDTAKDTFDK